MKCYNHHQQDVVGICKNCLKGIYAECATDIGGGITCSAECEADAKKPLHWLKIQ